MPPLRARPTPRALPLGRRLARGAGGAVTLAACLAANPALADGTSAATTAATNAAVARSLGQPHTMAELGVGVLALPTADVCLRPGSCSRGDTGVVASIWQMYRANLDFAVGAGISLAMQPAADTVHSGEAGISRSHTRSYFLVEAQGRYYALHRDWAEAWVGLTAGGVVVSDRYSIDGGDQSQAALLGPRASTVRTEGLSGGALVGAGWSFAPNWTVSASIRLSRWWLPHEPAKTVFGDTATLRDTQNVVDLGLALGYRIAL